MMRFLGRAGQNISAQTTTHYFNTTDGKPIYVYLILMKSNHCHMYRCLIHLLNGSLEVFEESYLIRLCIWISLGQLYGLIAII